eukprot:scaffold106944_cov48-Phaeocystis_antarctica.AAC.1
MRYLGLLHIHATGPTRGKRYGARRTAASAADASSLSQPRLLASFAMGSATAAEIIARSKSAREVNCELPG